MLIPPILTTFAALQIINYTLFIMKYFSLLLAVILLLSFQVLSQTSPPPDDLTGIDLRTWLKKNTYDDYHNQLGYADAREAMYGYIDERADGEVYGVYTGFHQTAETTTYLDPINCEHTVPQSFFGSSEPMRSDIHHLFPTHKSANSARSNYPFGNVPDENATSWYIVNASNSGIDILSSPPSSNAEKHSKVLSAAKFEPRDDHKGDAARAVFYFYTMYPTQAGDITSAGNLEVLFDWHVNDPPDAWEKQRNNRIEQEQGNRNPYIDNPEIVEKAWDPVIEFTSAPVTEIDANSPYNYSISVAGDNGPDFTIDCAVKPDWLSFEQTADNTATLTGTPSDADVGTHDVTLTVTDGNERCSQFFTITVSADPGELIFVKDFEDQSLTSGGWTEENVTGDQSWEVPAEQYGYNNSYCAAISGYDNGAQENENWLISPAFSPDDYQSLSFSFRNTSGYDGPAMQAYYLYNYSGTITDADQTEISGINWHDGNADWVWTFSGDIDLSDLQGQQAHIGFKYSSTNSTAAKWELDDIALYGKENSTSITETRHTDFSIFPNPAQNILQISRPEKLQTVKIFTLRGREIIRTDNKFSRIDISGLKPGLYFIRLQDSNDNSYSLKLIKQ